MAETSRQDLSRLWILAQYQSFRAGISFQEAGNEVLGSVKKDQRDGREFLYEADRRQKLGKMSETKQQRFIKFWEGLFREIPFLIDGHRVENIFDYAIKSQSEYLINGSSREGFLDLFGAQVKMAQDELQAIEEMHPPLIQLPQLINIEFNRSFNPITLVSEEIMPF